MLLERGRRRMLVRGQEPGPLFCAVIKTGRLVHEGSGGLRRLSGSAAWAICKERGQKAAIQAPAPHDLRVQPGFAQATG
jgi:hypothetical protein